jgi:hypothetical protein
MDIHVLSDLASERLDLQERQNPAGLQAEPPGFSC